MEEREHPQDVPVFDLYSRHMVILLLMADEQFSRAHSQNRGYAAFRCFAAVLLIGGRSPHQKQNTITPASRHMVILLLMADEQFSRAHSQNRGYAAFRCFAAVLLIGGRSPHQKQNTITPASRHMVILLLMAEL